MGVKESGSASNTSSPFFSFLCFFVDGSITSSGASISMGAAEVEAAGTTSSAGSDLRFLLFLSAFATGSLSFVILC